MLETLSNKWALLVLSSLRGHEGPMRFLNRELSAEWARYGVRTVCLHTTGMPETGTIDVVFGLHAEAHGITRAQFTDLMSSMSRRKAPTKLAEFADVAAFVVSDQAAAMTGTVVNLTGGVIVD